MVRNLSAISKLPLFLAFAALAMCFVGAAHAGDFLFQWDNDKVADTDRHYTNGMRIGYVPTTPAEQLTDVSGFLVNTFGYGGFPNHTPKDLRSGWVLGQDMYTPEDVDAAVPNPLDRPYAGWTYFGVTVQNESDAGFTSLDQQDTIELDLGIVGPEARAGETQNHFHRLINVSQSRGWDHQIGTEPGVLLTRTVKFRTAPWKPFATDQLGFDAIPHATGQIGNVKTGVSTGVTLRMGGNLGQDFGPIYGTFALPRKTPDRFTWSFFAGAEVRLVARDIFLDGNTFKDSPDVKHNLFVLENRVGVMFHVPIPDGWGIDGVRLDISHVQRTREFTTQDKSDRYGSFKLTLNY